MTHRGLFQPQTFCDSVKCIEDVCACLFGAWTGHLRDVFESTYENVRNVSGSVGSCSPATCYPDPSSGEALGHTGDSGLPSASPPSPEPGGGWHTPTSA